MSLSCKTFKHSLSNVNVAERSKASEYGKLLARIPAAVNIFLILSISLSSRFLQLEEVEPKDINHDHSHVAWMLFKTPDAIDHTRPTYI